MVVAIATCPAAHVPVLAASVTFASAWVWELARLLTAVAAIAIVVLVQVVALPVVSNVQTGTIAAVPYGPAVMPVVFIAIVPVAVIGPPVIPSPVATLVTVPTLVGSATH